MKALIVVDVQNDFCPEGALPAQKGDEVVPVINALREGYPLTVFTQDWHPRNHESFASNHPGRKPGEVIDLHGIEQILWPDHCVQESPGAAFHPGLDVRPDDPVVRKGELPGVDSYSGFLDNDRKHETGLRDLLQRQGVTEVHVVGLATDYCVKYTVLDALKFGFTTLVHKGGCRPVNLNPGDEEQAFREMERAGATLLA